MEVTPVPLAAAVDLLRMELSKAVKERPENGILFSVQAVELELQVVAETNSSDELTGGWSLLGWNMGGAIESGQSNAGVHTVKLTLGVAKVDETGELRDVTIHSEDDSRR